MTKSEMWEAIREHYGLKRNVEFARFFQITDQTANGWSRKGVLDPEIVYKFCPEISPDWLLSQGEVGPMLRPASQNINGDHNTQVGGDLKQECNDTIQMALDLVAAEQENNKKMQEQNQSLIEIISNLTKNK